MSPRADSIRTRYSIREVTVDAENSLFFAIFFEQFWCAMTKDEVKQRAFTAHFRESLMVAGKRVHQRCFASLRAEAH